MSLLTGPEILKRMKTGDIVIEPFAREMLNPNSVNLRLGDTLLIYSAFARQHELLSERQRHSDVIRRLHDNPDDGDYVMSRLAVKTLDAQLAAHDPPPLDMAAETPTTRLTIPPTGIILFPGILYLGHTIEHTATKNLAPMLEGRSSIGRLGLAVHITAGFGDDGFTGQWVLELATTHPLRIYPGVAICQVAYTMVTGESSGYRGKYQGQRGPVPSGLWKEFQKAK